MIISVCLKGVYLEIFFKFLKKLDLCFLKKVFCFNLLNFRYKFVECYNVLVFIFFLFMIFLYNYWILLEKCIFYLYECIIEMSVFF